MRLARERHPALILMDIQLPGINGVEALHRLRADPLTHDTPIIAVTASVMPQDRTRIMAAGFDGFQGKPISIKHIRAPVLISRRCPVEADGLESLGKFVELTHLRPAHERT